MAIAEQRLFRSVSKSAKALVKQAEHLFRNVFRANWRRGRLRPPHWAKQNTISLGVFQCFVGCTRTSAHWKIHQWQRLFPAIFARNQLPRLIASQFSRSINSLFAMCRTCHVGQFNINVQ
ncbi:MULTISPECIES: hypothetical protein [unclassified Bradyrhizobium]|jgi:hypothetical protein|uniref:hypothetical protein n=1 Tax=unclassified Bradyrhizobium TaxID=2631580 RepID=UPI00104FC993|nr:MULTISPECIES: hypothetical protein [unclassified Bradyrhizobium]